MTQRTTIKKTNNLGFTLIEVMVVIVILGILAVYIAPKILDKPEEAKQAKAKFDIVSLETALKLYKLDNGFYPTTEQGLLALITKPETAPVPKNWASNGYLEKNKIPKDPWKNDFVYISPGMKGPFEIISYGADGIQGGEGFNKDIHNWEIE